MPGPKKNRSIEKSSYGISVNADHTLSAVAEFYVELKSRGYPTFMLLTYDTTAEYDMNSNRASYGDPNSQILFATDPCQAKDILDIFNKHYEEVNSAVASTYVNLVVRKIYR